MPDVPTPNTSDVSPPKTTPESTTDPTGSGEQPANLLAGGDQPAGGEGDSADDQGGDAGGAEGGEKDQQQPEVPEKYELKPPEGVELDEKFIDEFAGVAKELRMTQEQAQAAFAKYLEVQQQELARIEEETARQIQEWAAETRKMWGSAFEEKRAAAARAYAEMTKDIPELADVIEGMGLGTHPAVLKLFHRIAELTQEDKFVRGKEAGPGLSESERLAKLYPKTAKR